MAQTTKFTIDPNLSGIQLRTQASEMLTALSTLNSGNLEPANPSAGMLWLDTTKNILKIRDKTNTAWLDFAGVNDKVIAASAADSAKLGGLAADKYALKSEASDGLKIGSYLLWSSDRTTPAGFLPADGRRLQKSEYIELFDVIGYTYGGSGENFNLPKFNDGKFIRATGGNAASLGVSQDDAIRDIVGELINTNDRVTGTGAFKRIRDGDPLGGLYGGPNGRTVEFKASSVVPTANENRPYNMSVIVLIKVKNVFEATNIDKSPYATETKAGIVKLKNSITGNLSDTAVSEKAAKEYMDKNASIGIGQSWQDVTAQKQYGVIYTNTTGRPIMVYIGTVGGGGVIVSLEVNGIEVANGGYAAGSGSDGINTIVPPNATYKLTGNGTGFGKWAELR